MKKFLLSSMIALLAVAVGSAHAEDTTHNPEFDNVPAGSWPYAALAQLVERGEVEGYKAQFVARPMTRYEFAVALSRWMGRNGFSDTLDKSSKDIACALGYEFAPQIVRLRSNEDFEPNPLEAKIKTTPASEWFEVWRGTLYGETRIQIPPRIHIPASFLHRRHFRFRFLRPDSQPSAASYLRLLLPPESKRSISSYLPPMLPMPETYGNPFINSEDANH